MSERRWTLSGVGPAVEPPLGVGEWVQVMPVREHEEALARATAELERIRTEMYRTHAGAIFQSWADDIAAREKAEAELAALRAAARVRGWGG